mmetsp:Transcript_10175/g.23789  ORF Transcript_10175/g.23789 Transcript_10175/m.23789 type:complete len:363 (-) Transcript_10175:55-1143(-)
MRAAGPRGGMAGIGGWALPCWRGGEAVRGVRCLALKAPSSWIGAAWRGGDGCRGGELCLCSVLRASCMAAEDSTLNRCTVLPAGAGGGEAAGRAWPCGCGGEAERPPMLPCCCWGCWGGCWGCWRGCWPWEACWVCSLACCCSAGERFCASCAGSIDVLRVVVVVTVSMSLPTSVRTSTVVLLAGTQRTTGTHSMVVVRLTMTPLGSSAGVPSRGATAWRHFGHVRRIPSHLDTQDVWKKCLQGSSSTSSSASYPTWQISHILSSASLSTWSPRIFGATPRGEAEESNGLCVVASSPSFDSSESASVGVAQAQGWGHRSMTSSKLIFESALRTSGGVPLTLSSSSSLSLSLTPPPCPFCCCA